MTFLLSIPLALALALLFWFDWRLGASVVLVMLYFDLERRGWRR